VPDAHIPFLVPSLHCPENAGTVTPLTTPVCKSSIMALIRVTLGPVKGPCPWPHAHLTRQVRRGKRPSEKLWVGRGLWISY
jgi:hypothetical protein